MSKSLHEVDPEILRSTSWLRFFVAVLSHRLRTSFHAVRLAKPGVPDLSEDLPLVVYCNHASWWDAALVPVLMTRLFPLRRSFAPMDAAAIQRYRFMRKIGMFGVATGSYEGASRFMRVGRKLLSQSDTLFYLTPQGRFTDARDHPIRLQPGLSRLLSRVSRVSVLPLAIEYPFWDESTPEVLVRFGDVQVMGSAVTTDLSEIQDNLQDRLSHTMAQLADDAVSRDRSRFDTLLHGRSGVGGVYDGWRRLKAWRVGEPFNPAHAPDGQVR